MAAVGWYGPLVDLSQAASHVEDFVQLLVFVHQSQTFQKSNVAKKGRGTSMKTMIQVGDGTRSYFSVTIWPNHVCTPIAAGDVVLLQNVKIVNFRNVLEATTLQVSALLILIHSYELVASKGIDELVANAQIGETTRGKLRRVIEWVYHTESAFQNIQHLDPVRKKPKNWKIGDQEKPRKCSSISEILNITNSCKAIFYASIDDDIFPFTGRDVEVGKEKLLFSKRLVKMTNDGVRENLIGRGCKLCGSCLSSRISTEENTMPLYCPDSLDYIHNLCLIYRPFLLNVWDETGRILILVRNKAAEILFGNITAHNVHRCYEEENSNDPNCCSDHFKVNAGLNFYQIWLIMVNVLLQQGLNSPFQFEITVDKQKDLNSGRFELVSFRMHAPNNISC